VLILPECEAKGVAENRERHAVKQPINCEKQNDGYDKGDY